MLDIEYQIAQTKVKTVFENYKHISYRFNNLNSIIQNGLDFIQKEDLDVWIKQSKEVEEDYKQLKQITYKMIKEELQRRNK